MLERSFKPGSRSKIVVMKDDVTGEIVSYAQWTLPLSNEREEERIENTGQGKVGTKFPEFPDGVNLPLFKRMFLGKGASEAEKGADLPVPQEKCWGKCRSRFWQENKHVVLKAIADH